MFEVFIWYTIMNRQCLIYLVLVALIIHQSSADLPAQKHLEEMLKKNPACKQIKCPSVSDPLCVKVRYVTSALEANTVYVVMINRCEMKYVTCYEGVDAKELPMVYCDHGKNITSDLKKLEERRRKMVVPNESTKIQEEKKRIESKMAKLATAVPKPIKIRYKRGIVYNDKEDSIQADIEKSNIAKKYKELSHINDVKRQLFENEPVINENKLMKRTNDTKPEHVFHVYIKDKKGVKKLNLVDKDAVKTKKLKNVDGENDGDQKSVDLNDGKKKTNDNIPRDDDEDENSADRRDRMEDYSERMDWMEEYSIHSGEDTKLEKVDMDQYVKGCPTSCPARGVMLCGRCKDGIFRTFLSPCHMRMFDCGHPDEKLTVVTWSPCAMSGPYLEDLRVPVGRIDEPHDDDVVLRYLKCSEYYGKHLKPYSRLNCTDFEDGLKLKKAHYAPRSTFVPYK